MKIQGQHFLITGANRGIGLAVASMAAREGAHLHLVMRSENSQIVNQMKALGAASVHAWNADLSSRNGVETLLESLKNQSIDLIFNNAGVLTGGLLEQQPLDDIYNLVQVNIASLIHLTRGLIPGMVERRRGKVINNASVSAFMHFPCASTYAASKAAVVAFTNCLEIELKDTGVSTLCLITPGIKTRMFDEIEVKYAGNMEIPQESITPDEYALQIRHAILNDATYLLPRGTTALGLWINKYLPSLFRSQVTQRFHR